MADGRSEDRREDQYLADQYRLETLQYEVENWSKKRDKELELLARKRERDLSAEELDYLEGFSIIVRQQQDALFEECQLLLRRPEALAMDQEELVKELLLELEE